MIYFIRAVPSGRIKIGHTSRVAEERRRSLQTGNAERLLILFTIEGNQATERNIHTRFAFCREEGEWFSPHPELLAFAEGVRLGLGHVNTIDELMPQELALLESARWRRPVPITEANEPFAYGLSMRGLGSVDLAVASGRLPEMRFFNINERGQALLERGHDDRP